MAVPLQGYPRPSPYYDPNNEAQFRAAVDASIAALDSAITEGVDLITANITFDGGVTFDGAVDFNAAADFSGTVTFTGATTVPEATVTAHQAALAIAESQITDGSILARLGDNETVTGAWTFNATISIGGALTTGADLSITSANDAVFGMKNAANQWDIISDNSPDSLRFKEVNGGLDVFTLSPSGPYAHVQGSGELLRLDDSSATGSPYLSFYQDGTLRGRIWYLNGAAMLYDNEAGTRHEFRSSSDEMIRLRHDETDGSPYLSFYQENTLRGYIQFSNGLPGLQLVSTEASAKSIIWTADAGGTIRDVLLIAAKSGSPGVQIKAEVEEVLRVGYTNPSGKPYMSFYQGSTRMAYIQAHTSTNRGLQIVNEQAFSKIRLVNNGQVVEFDNNTGDLTNLSGDVIATV